MKFLSEIGKAFKTVFAWLSSKPGQTIVQAGEGVALALFPQLQGIVNLANSWIQKAVTVESLAVSAEQSAKGGVEKAAAVIAQVTPEVLQYFPKATAEQIAKANDAIVAFLNAFETEPAK